MTQWQGDSLHFAVTGKFNGAPFDIHVEGDAAKDPATGVQCTRNYAPLPGEKPKADGTYDSKQLFFAMKEIGAVVEIDGKPMQISVGYWGHDPAVNTSLNVVPRVRGGSIAAGNTWVDFELSDPTAVGGTMGPTDVEKAAEAGKLSMKLNAGTPDSSGVFIPSGGKTGQFLDLTWGPEEHLTISTTAECTSVLAVWAGRSITP